jgi:Peptidase dimerisation domain
VHSVAGHSGSTRTGAGAITKAAYLIRTLSEVPLPGPPGPEFPVPAKLTVTAISGGEGYSMVPDLCTVNVDIRLTPALDDPAAAALLEDAVASADAEWPGTAPTEVEVTTRWPPYALPDGSPLRDALLTGAARAGLAPVAKVAGPSNIGNYLAGLGIPATAGFGLQAEAVDGADGVGCHARDRVRGGGGTAADAGVVEQDDLASGGERVADGGVEVVEVAHELLGEDQRGTCGDPEAAVSETSTADFQEPGESGRSEGSNHGWLAPGRGLGSPTVPPGRRAPSDRRRAR